MSNAVDLMSFESVKGYAKTLGQANDQLRRQLEQAEARVTELQSAAQQLICSGTGPLADNTNRSLSALILRKQAEAAEKLAECLSGTRNKKLALSEANGLRFKASLIEKQADGAEQAGGPQ